MKEFKQKYKRKERVWNIALTLLVLISMLFSGIGYHYMSLTQFSENPIGYVFELAFFVIMGSMIGFLVVITPIDKLLRRTVLKSYFIEDAGDAIKLHGSVNVTEIERAYSELLSIRPGYKIVDDAYNKYGCTFAAVKATKNDLRAKKEVESFGIPVNTIG